MATLPPEIRVSDQILAQFRVFDQNGDGAIDKTELLNVLQSFDKDLWTNERVDATLKAADLNKDGVLQYEEFMKYLEKDPEGEFSKVAAKVTPIPAEAIVELVRQASTTSIETGKPDLLGALQALQEMPWEKKEPAISLMLKLLQNVAKNPGVEKYRHLKRTNATLQQKIFSVSGCAELLMAAGFEPQGDEELVLPEGADIQWVIDQLTEFGNEELMAQRRAERDARIAAVKAEEAKGKELKGMAKSSDADRKALLEKIEYDRQEREAREKLAAEGFREKVSIPAEKGGGDVTRFADIGVDVNRGGG
eukprot:TRINITY_DN92880_c0_g1_i1.p1 TRINITY_DN92880_c0_g1~~TRINITY_DN92880_c0_g1_i1.p1  ORF type:complete len:307 (-),score=89.66 TRINITY_DN92880_c0_g1_i1:159-1079(-)